MGLRDVGVGGILSEEVVVEGCGVIVSALRRLLAGACGRDSPIILESRRYLARDGSRALGSRPLNTEKRRRDSGRSSGMRIGEIFDGMCEILWRVRCEAVCQLGCGFTTIRQYTPSH